MPMPIGPPISIAWTVESFAPGIYRAFWSALIDGLAQQPVTVTSYWRDPARNSLVGGRSDSQHLIGLGIDLVPQDAEKAAAALRSRGLLVFEYSTHLHVQAWPAGLARGVGLLDALGL